MLYILCCIPILYTLKIITRDSIMFTGIIDHTATIIAISQHAQSLILQIQSQFSQLVLGESIAVDGVCLTVTSINGGVFSCDISPETLVVTHLSDLNVGAAVNVERALKMGDRLGGHFVTGHVDMLASVQSRQHGDGYVQLVLKDFSSTQMAYLTLKGSVCVNGVSLTINSVDLMHNTISLMLIPHTTTRTNLQYLQKDHLVHIEFDTMSKMVAHQLSLHQKQEAAHV